MLSHESQVSSQELIDRFLRVRLRTMKLCEGLEVEDLVVQGHPQVSPAKWHLGHTTWFFENFLLREQDYTPIDERFFLVFNSYYKSQGDHWIQGERGHLSRPTVSEVCSYREAIDERVVTELRKGVSPRMAEILNLGLHHEEQHQELLLMDLKFNFSLSPFNISYGATRPESDPIRQEFLPVQGGVVPVGAQAQQFCYDNELPRHRTYIEDFLLANRPVTCGDYLEFMQDGGYQRHELWHSEAWANMGDQVAPHYWRKTNEGWTVFTLSGWQPVDLNQPVSHVTFFEASAFAEWTGARLPTEQEWEWAASEVDDSSMRSANLLKGDVREAHLRADRLQGAFYELVGGLWEWTSSSYSPYPGFRKPEGAFGEYNAKFMCNQYVLRGGAFATPEEHIRISYRNFYQSEKSWMFSGIRLAKEA